MNDELDILHVVEACGAGVRRHLKLIMPELTRRGIRCGVFAFGARYDRDFPSDLAHFEQVDGCKVWSFPSESNGVMSLWRAVRQLRGVLREVRPQAVHLHSSVAGFVGRLACKALPGVKVVWGFTTQQKVEAYDDKSVTLANGEKRFVTETLNGGEVRVVDVTVPQPEFKGNSMNKNARRVEVVATASEDGKALLRVKMGLK